MRERKVMKLASRGKRLGAFCIDAVVPVISGLILFVTMIVMAVTMPGRMGGQQGFGYNPYSEFGYGYGYGYDRGVSGGIVAAILISMILFVAYTVVQIVFYNKSRTIGKAALGLQVISSADGEPIGFWKMLFREWFVKKASGAVFLLGYIWVLVDDKNRGWHDKILDTYVVDLKESELLSRSEKKKARPVQRQEEAPAPAAEPVSMTDALPAPEAVVPEPETEVTVTTEEQQVNSIDEKVTNNEQE